MRVSAWILKSEPDTFGIDHLAASPEKATLWDGVRNYQARNYLLAMKKGDRAFFYHSSAKVTGIAGEMTVIAEAVADPSQFDSDSPYFDAKSTPEKPLWFSPKLKLVKKYPAILTRQMLAKTVLKNSLLFTSFRLSVIPLTTNEVKAIDRLLESKR